MKKIITNKDKLPPKLRNYVAKRKTWVDKDNRYEHYIYMDTVDKDFRVVLETMANWQLHENYSYMCFKGLVPRTTFMMVGFDWEKCDYAIKTHTELLSDFAEFEDEIEVDWTPTLKYS